MTARELLADAVDRRAAEMFEEDAPLGLAPPWPEVREELRVEYRRFAERELQAESRVPRN